MRAAGKAKHLQGEKLLTEQTVRSRQTPPSKRSGYVYGGGVPTSKLPQCQDDIHISSRKPVLQITVSGYRPLEDASLAPMYASEEEQPQTDLLLHHFVESLPDFDDVVYQLQFNGLFVLNLTIDKDILIEVVPELVGALQRLWSAYQTGRLDRMLQNTLVSEELLRCLNVEAIELRSSINLQDVCTCYLQMTFGNLTSDSPPVREYVRRHCFALLDSTHAVVAGLNVMSSVPPAWSFILAANLRTAEDAPAEDRDVVSHTDKGIGQEQTQKPVCMSPVYERPIDCIIQCDPRYRNGQAECTEEEGKWIIDTEKERKMSKSIMSEIKEESTKKTGKGTKEKIKMIAGEGTFVTAKAVGKEIIKKQAGSAGAAAGIGLTAAFEGVTFARRTAGSVKKLREDKLSGGQFAGEMAKHATKGVFSGGGTVAGATLGQMAIPVPVLGAVIGGVIGNMIGQGAGYVAADVAPDFLMRDGRKWKARTSGDDTAPEGKTTVTDSEPSDTSQKTALQTKGGS